MNSNETDHFTNSNFGMPYHVFLQTPMELEEIVPIVSQHDTDLIAYVLMVH